MSASTPEAFPTNPGPARSSKSPDQIERHDQISERRITLADLGIQGGMAGFCATGAVSLAAAVAPMAIALGLFASLGGLRLWFARRASPPRWAVYTSIVADFALFYLILIAFHWRPEQSPDLLLETPVLNFVFVLIALRALRFKMQEMILSGAVAALGWVLVTIFAFATASAPALLDFNLAKSIAIQAEKVVAIGLLTGVICLASARGAKYLRQTAEDAARIEAALLRETRLNRELARESDEKERANRELFQAANYDKLTGEENRFAFNQRAQAAAETFTSDPTSPFAIAVIDLNRFRSFNDGFGRCAGDALIRRAAILLRSALQPGECLARVAADEFAVLLPSVQNRADAAMRAANLRAVLAEPIGADGHSFVAGASIGVAVSEPGDSGGAVFAFADIALNEAKRSGGGGLHLHDPASRSQISARAELESALREARHKNELELRYQPLIGLTDGRIAGWEALMRWSRDGRDMVSPATFIPIAEETGAIIDIGVWALEQAATDARTFAEAGAPEDAFMSVNVSPRQFIDPERLQLAVSDALQLYSQLKLEVTESAIVEDPVKGLMLLEALRDSGARLALDDFGTGASSLSQLRRFPFATLKIDQSFVRDETEGGREYLHAIVGIARALGLDTVAEGIETPADLDACTAAGVTYGQGYLLGRPETAAQAIERIQQTPAAKTA